MALFEILEDALLEPLLSEEAVDEVALALFEILEDVPAVILVLVETVVEARVEEELAGELEEDLSEVMLACAQWL